MTQADNRPEIRTIKSDEPQHCAEIYTKAWNSAMPAHAQRNISVADFRRETEGELTLVYEDGDQLCGYISIWEPDWFIHHLYIEPSMHGSGIGRALVEHVQSLASNRRHTKWEFPTDRDKPARSR